MLKKIIHKNGAFSDIEFTYKGEAYRVIQSDGSKGHSVWTTVDMVKKMSSGEKIRKTRKQWQEYFSNPDRKPYEKKQKYEPKDRTVPPDLFS